MANNKYKSLKVIVPVGIVLTFIALFLTPLLLTAAFKVSTVEIGVSPSKMAFKVTALVYICAVPYVAGLFKLKSICNLMLGENPFDRKIAKLFNDLSLCAFLEAVLFTAATLVSVYALNIYLYAFTVLSVIIVVFVSVTAGLVFKVMSDIFNKASDNKEEIDLTF